MKIIETTEDLKKLCLELENQQFITVDSEFVREKTYYSKLCLLQVGWLDDAAIIDPLSENINLQPFFDILQNKNILKVFHSGRQDIEIFYNMTGRIPYPVFDTQVAAMVCGFGSSISYDCMVRLITKVELDKSSRLTDWTKRPLEKRQLEYALRDVTFLIPCYLHLDKYLKENNRESWIQEELENNLLNENLYKTDPDNMWQKIKHSIHSAQFLCVLKEIAAWREKRAQKHNIPRQSFIKDEILVNIAAVAPKNIDELKSVRNIRSDIVSGKLGSEIIEAVNTALNRPFSNELKKIEREKEINIPRSALALIEVLKLLLKIKSEQLGVVPRLIASEKDLRDIACGKDKNNPALTGWRFDVFGKDALSFRKGKAKISYDTVKKDIVISNS